jgi:1,4-dihydroxy-6-naphthoate synthase
VLKLAISPCPNDTFAFHHLVASGAFEVSLDDVEALNRLAGRGEADVVKISVAAYGWLRRDYALLRAGGAAGYGVGPIVVARERRAVGGRVAIPGERTSAALLLRLLGRFETVPMRFDRIEDAVLEGRADCGVLIHEGRFTYGARGLVALADLGAVWEERMRMPVALGAIAIRRALGPDVAREIDGRIRESVAHARAHPEASAAFVREHATEMAPDVVRRHIALYVNDYTLALDEAAVLALLAFGEREGLFPSSDLPVFAYATRSSPPKSGV